MFSCRIGYFSSCHSIRIFRSRKKLKYTVDTHVPSALWSLYPPANFLWCICSPYFLCISSTDVSQIHPEHLACVSFTEAQTSCLWCLGREAPGLLLMPNFWKAQVPSVKCAVLTDNLAYPPLDFKSSPSFLQYLVDWGSVDNDLLFKEQWQDTKVFIYSLETWIFPQMFWICSWLTSQMCSCKLTIDVC